MNKELIERVKKADEYHNSLSIRYNGIEILHAFTKAPRPESSQDIDRLLQEIIDIHKAPEIEDKELF